MGALEALVISTLIVGAIFMFVISVSELFR